MRGLRTKEKEAELEMVERAQERESKTHSNAVVVGERVSFSFELGNCGIQLSSGPVKTQLGDAIGLIHVLGTQSRGGREEKPSEKRLFSPEGVPFAKFRLVAQSKKMNVARQVRRNPFHPRAADLLTFLPFSFAQTT